jgi:hypothetical protein
VPHVEKELLILPKHLSSPTVFRSVVFCVKFCRSLFVVFCLTLYWLSIYVFWLSILYLQSFRGKRKCLNTHINSQLLQAFVIRNGAKTISLQTLFGRLNKYVKQRVKQRVIIPYHERLCASLVLIFNNLKCLPILLHVFRSLFCIQNMIIKPGLMGEPVLPKSMDIESLDKLV